MPVLYFDNFRGFSTTLLKLKEINFFVGENSTGKSSVLKLIGILSSHGFWRYGEFGKDEISLGGFNDIITYPSKNKEYIEVGILNDESSTDIFGIKLKFIDRQNFPFLKEISFRNSHINLQAIIDGKFLKYRFQIIKDESFSLSAFESWVKNNQLNEIGFLRIEIQSMGILPILSQLRLIVGSDFENAHPIPILVDPFLFPFAWMAPIRAEPQRSYHHQGLIFNAEGKHSPSVLKEILLGPDVKKILNRFGTDSGLYDDITIRDLSEENSTTFEILVSINRVARNLVNVGYGVSQVLPIIIESIARDDYTWFATQQPEVHLHPRAQAALGDFIFKTNERDNQKFIIETHSDYMIDRFRLRLNRALREGNKGTGNIGQVVFFEKNKNGNKLRVIEFNGDGSYPEEQPKEFRDFFIKEQLELISI